MIRALTIKKNLDEELITFFLHVNKYLTAIKNNGFKVIDINTYHQNSTCIGEFAVIMYNDNAVVK